ncbi:MAG: hypothetical protein Q9171_006454 [Xanthocarpia ochracea]
MTLGPSSLSFQPALYAPNNIAANLSKLIDDHPAREDLDPQAHLPMDGDRFSSTIFQVSTGAGQTEYAVHETCLRKSPVFARMCNTGFREALEKRITLPEERPNLLGAIIEYLYTDDFWTRGHGQTDLSKRDKAFELAHLYVSAAQYGLEAMKDLIVAKLRRCSGLNDLSNWLEVADIIYESNLSRDEPYPIYFRSLVVRLLDATKMSAHLVDETLENRIDMGGPLAVDIHRAYKMSNEKRTYVETNNKLRGTATMVSGHRELFNDSVSPEKGSRRRKRKSRPGPRRFVAPVVDSYEFRTRERDVRSGLSQPRFVAPVVNSHGILTPQSQ